MIENTAALSWARVRANHHHWTLSRAEYLLRRRALKEPLESHISAAAEHDEINFMLAGKLIHGRGHFARQEHPFELLSVQTMSLDEPLQPGAPRSADALHFRNSGRLGTQRKGKHIEYVNHVHIRVVMALHAANTRNRLK